MRILKPVLIVAGLIGAGVIFGYSLAKFVDFSFIIPDKSDVNFWYFIFLLLSLFLAIAIHELGHLLAGLVQGFSFELFIVGPLGVKRDENRKIKPQIIARVETEA